MNCEVACHLMDDYLENRLSRFEHHNLEKHLASCSGCTREVRQHPAFEEQMWRAVQTSVQHLHLSAEASSRIIDAAQQSARRGAWSKRAAVALQLMAGAAVIVLLVAGMLAVMGRLPGSPAPSLVPPPSSSRPALSMSHEDILIEPYDLQPGEPFTTTIFLHSQLTHPVDAIRFKLEITGPSGEYRFVLALKGPFPAQGVSVLHVTPELLTTPCREQYGITPDQIIRETGIYTVRATLLSPVNMPQQ